MEYLIEGLSYDQLSNIHGGSTGNPDEITCPDFSCGLFMTDCRDYCQQVSCSGMGCCSFRT